MHHFHVETSEVENKFREKRALSRAPALSSSGFFMTCLQASPLRCSVEAHSQGSGQQSCDPWIGRPSLANCFWLIKTKILPLWLSQNWASSYGFKQIHKIQITKSISVRLVLSSLAGGIGSNTRPSLWSRGWSARRTWWVDAPLPTTSAFWFVHPLPHFNWFMRTRDRSDLEKLPLYVNSLFNNPEKSGKYSFKPGSLGFFYFFKTLFICF